MKAKVSAPLVIAVSWPQMFAVGTRSEVSAAGAIHRPRSRRSTASAAAATVVGSALLSEESNFYRSPLCYYMSDRKDPYRSWSGTGNNLIGLPLPGTATA